MRDILADYALWILAFHLIAVMFWMAGLYYLPRLFVYHAQAIENGEPHEVFERMEHNLLAIIMNPSMIAAWVFGFALLIHDDFWANAGHWLSVKLVLVVILSAYHRFLAQSRRKFLSGHAPHPARFYRIVNEIPPIMTIIIVIMVIVRPF